MSTTIRRFCIAAAAILASTAASATVVTVTLQGTTGIVNGTIGLLGQQGTNLTNQPFTQVFTINTKGGNVLSTPTGVSSNSIFGDHAPYAVGSLLTIGGDQFQTDGSNYSSAFISGQDYQLLSDDVPANDNLITSLDLHGAGLPATLTQPISLAIDGTVLSALDSFIFYLPGMIDLQGTLAPTSVVVAIASVPEPGTLGLAALSLGAVAVRVRKARAN